MVLPQASSSNIVSPTKTIKGWAVTLFALASLACSDTGSGTGPSAGSNETLGQVRLAVESCDVDAPPLVVSVPDNIVTSDCEDFPLPVPSFTDACGGDEFFVRGGANGMRIDPGESFDLPLGATDVGWTATAPDGSQTTVSYTANCIDPTSCEDDPPIVISASGDVVTSDCEGFRPPVPTFTDGCGGDPDPFFSIRGSFRVLGADTGSRIEAGESIDLPLGTTRFNWSGIMGEGITTVSYNVTCVDPTTCEPPILVSVPDDIVTSDCHEVPLPVPTFTDGCGGDDLVVRGGALGIRIDPGDRFTFPPGTTVVGWTAFVSDVSLAVSTSYTVTCLDETTCHSATIEAETMDHAVGGPAPEGWNIWSNGDISTTHDFAPGPTRITVRARGEPALGVFPHMVVSVGGSPIGSTTVSSTEFADYDFHPFLTAGPQLLSITFDNDFFTPPEDRNLIVDHVAVDCRTIPPSLSGELVLFTDWGAGYCMGVFLTNEGGQATSSWQAVIDVQDTVIDNLWNAHFTAATDQVTLTPLSWNSAINPGETNQSIGFCASRPAGGNAVATLVSTTGTAL